MKRPQKYRNSKGKFITKKQAQQTARVPLILLIIVLSLILIPYGAMELQAKVQDWTTTTMDRQDLVLEVIREDVDIMIVPVEDIYDRTPSDVAMWYVDKTTELINADLDTAEKILAEMHQYARDTIYLEEIINIEQ